MHILEIIGIILAGLIVIPFLITTIQAIIGVREPEFNIMNAEYLASKERWPHRTAVS